MSTLSTIVNSIVPRAVFFLFIAIISCRLMYEFDAMKTEVRGQFILVHLVAILTAYVSLAYDKWSAQLDQASKQSEAAKQSEADKQGKAPIHSESGPVATVEATEATEVEKVPHI